MKWNAAELAVFAFVCALLRTVFSAVLHNALKKLPTDLNASLWMGSEIAYAAIPTIGSLAESLRIEVKDAFAESMAVIWKTTIGISGVCHITAIFLREMPMNTHIDGAFGLSGAPSRSSEEEASIGDKDVAWV